MKFRLKIPALRLNKQCVGISAPSAHQAFSDILQTLLLSRANLSDH